MATNEHRNSLFSSTQRENLKNTINMVNVAKMEGDIRLIVSLEAIFIFSLVWGAGVNIRKHKRFMFQ